MKGLLLAGGIGSRLRPLTNVIPKCMVPINGRPLLDIWLEFLVDAGINEVLINTHYMASFVQEYVHKSTWRKMVTISYEETLLGTAGTILKNKDFFNKEPFFVAHADNLSRFQMSDFIDSHLSLQESIATMMLFYTNEPESCGIVELKDRVVHKFYEKQSGNHGNLANAAVYIFNPSIFNILEGLSHQEMDISLDVIPLLLGQINTFINTDYHLDIGSNKTYNQANNNFMPSDMHPENSILWKHMFNSVNL